MNSLRSNILSLNYERSTQSGCKDIHLSLWQRLNSLVEYCLNIIEDLNLISQFPDPLEQTLLAPEIKIIFVQF